MQIVTKCVYQAFRIHDCPIGSRARHCADGTHHISDSPMRLRTISSVSGYSPCPRFQRNERVAELGFRGLFGIGSSSISRARTPGSSLRSCSLETAGIPEPHQGKSGEARRIYEAMSRESPRKWNRVALQFIIHRGSDHKGLIFGSEQVHHGPASISKLIGKLHI